MPDATALRHAAPAPAPSRRRTALPGLAAVAAVAASLLAGCAPVRDLVLDLNASARRGVDGLAARSVADPALDFETSGPLELDVRLFAGDVTVVADPDATATRVEVTRVANHGRGRSDRAADSLDEIDVRATIRRGELGQSLVVRTTSAHEESEHQRTDVRIRTADVENVTIRTERGSVVLEDVDGRVDVEARGPRLRVITVRPLSEAVRLVNHAGDVDLRVRGTAQGILDFEAVRGRTYADVREGRLRILEGTSHRTLRGRFNDGTNPVVLRAADGDVRFASVDRPHAVGLFIIE